VKTSDLNYQSAGQAEGVSITYYTDPLCCWSWALEPELDKLNDKLKGLISWRFCMGGLIPSWQTFSDPVNSVSRPLQMGPVWMHAGQIANVPINHSLWLKDPPGSSYPACIAFKCVQLQSEEYAKYYLRLLRVSCMVNGINIGKQTELLQLADQLKEQFPEFDKIVFSRDLINGNGREAFRLDINEIKTKNIDRFPCLIIRQENRPSLLLSGYRPYEDLLQVINSNFILPSLKGEVKDV
jgi:putative protein-disulfide isomerase